MDKADRRALERILGQMSKSIEPVGKTKKLTFHVHSDGTVNPIINVRVDTCADMNR